MDITTVATQLLSYLGKNPELISQFIKHPYSTTAKATGSNEQISKEDMSQVVTAAAALSKNQKLGGSDIANIAAALLGQNNNSVHALTNMLFGGGAQAVSNATAQSGSVDLGSLVNMATLASTLMNATSAKPQAQQQAAKPGVNLADGLDLGEIATLAGQFLGANSAAPAQQQTATPSAGLDFGTIAQLASLFLGK